MNSQGQRFPKLEH